MSVLIGDERYSVRKEFTGDPSPAPGLMVGQRWVVRFCGDFVRAVTDKGAAMREVAAHQANRRTQ